MKSEGLSIPAPATHLGLLFFLRVERQASCEMRWFLVLLLLLDENSGGDERCCFILLLSWVSEQMRSLVDLDALTASTTTGGNTHLKGGHQCKKDVGHLLPSVKADEG